MTRSFDFPAALLLAALALLCPAAAQAQSFLTLDFDPIAISADGVVVVGTQQGQAVRWTPAAGVEPLGALPGSSSYDRAYAVSADGSVVVGESRRQAFRWTADGGMQGLGFLPGGGVSSVALGVSADGAIVVGSGMFSNYIDEAFSWTASGGMHGLGDLPGDWSDSEASDISADGTVIVGAGGYVRPNHTPGTRAVFWVGSGGIQTLPFLPGGDGTTSRANRVSADGSVIVGHSITSGAVAGGRAYEAARWIDGAISGLGHLPADLGLSSARTMSADGSVIGGSGGSGGPFLWTEADGMRSLKDVLEIDYGLDLAGWTLEHVMGISADGTLLVGTGRAPSGEHKGFRATLAPAFAVTAPAAEEIVPPNKPYTVQFTAPAGVQAVDLFLVRTLNPNGPRTLVAEDVSAAAGIYQWDVPDDLLSPSTFLVAVDADDDSREAVSARFRVRDPWRLHRVIGSIQGPEYERFEIDVHGWSFAQTDAALWPPSYWDRPSNDYSNVETGYDPVVGPGVRYHPAFFEGSQRWEHTPWGAWVRAFSAAGTYASLEPLEIGVLTVDQPNPVALQAWQSTHGAVSAPNIFAAANASYSGACSGVAASVLMAFQDPERFDAAFLPGTGGSEHLAAVPLNDEVRDAIHALQNYQFSVRTLNDTDQNHVFDPMTPRDVLARLRARFESDDRSLDRTVWFESEVREFRPDGTRAMAAHAVAALGMARLRDGVYRVGTFDPNLGPNGERALVIDSTANAWTFEDGDFIGATGTGLYVSGFVAENFVPATGPWAYLLDGETLGGEPSAVSDARRGGEPTLMSVNVAGAESAVTGSGGEVRYAAGALIQTLPFGYALFPLTGHASTPYRYRVPVGTYGAEVVADSTGSARLSIVRDRLTVGYERAGGTPGARDGLALGDDGLTLTGGTGGSVGMVAIATVGAGASVEVRRLRADSLAVGPGATAALVAVVEAFRLRGPAGATSYDLTLDRAASGGVRSFFHAAVPLAAGATHTVRPDWAMLGAGPVTVEVDLDGDGVTDETLTLANEVFTAASESVADVPAALALAAWPNPARGAATVSVAVPMAGPVRVEAFDALGRRVALLHDGPLAAGTHALRFDTARLPAGVYVVRAAAATATAVQRITVVR